MEIHLICPCESELNIQDGSEDRVLGVLTLWFEHHAGHRKFPDLAE